MIFDSKSCEVLRDLAGIARVTATRFVVVGACARDAALGAMQVPPSRATLDVDVAVQVESWDSFDVLIAAAVDEEAPFEAAGAPQALRHRNGMRLDVVPFGQIGSPPGTVQWRGDGCTMTVQGFHQVLAHAVEVEVGGVALVSVADLTSVVFTKALAFIDRGVVDPKDMTDLLELLEARDNNASDEDFLALLDVERQVGVEDSLDFAYLTGHQVRSRFGRDAALRIATAFDGAEDPLSPLVDRAVGRYLAYREDSIQRASDSLSSFRQGLQSHRSGAA